MRTKLLIIALCLSAFFLFVIFGAISSLPADIAVSHMSLPKSVKITGATGTVQNGFAERVRSGAFSVSNVSWSSGGLIDLLRGRAHISVDDPKLISASADLTAAPNLLVLEHLTGTGTVDRIVKYIGLAKMPVKFTGNVDLKFPYVAFQNGKCDRVAGRIMLSELTGKVQGQVFDLGAGEFKFECRKGNSEAKVLISSEMYTINGNFTVTSKGATLFRGSLTPNQELEPELRMGLSLFGKENKDGSYSFTVRDHF